MPEHHGGLLTARMFLDKWSDSPEMRTYKADRRKRVLGEPPLPIESALEGLLGCAFHEGASEEAAERDGERT